MSRLYTISGKTETDIDNVIAEGLEKMLAATIRQHPILYDKSNEFHLVTVHPKMHANIWQRISDEVNLEIGSCKLLWTCIKQKFTKYRKRLDNGEKITKEWPLYPTLAEWLDVHIKKRR